MNEYPDNKKHEKGEAEQPSTAVPTEENVVDAEYVDESEQESQNLNHEEDSKPAEQTPQEENDSDFDDELDDELESASDDEDADDEDTNSDVIDAEEADEATDGVEEQASTAQPIAKTKNMRWDTMFLLLLACITLIRLGYLYIVPLDLGPDESYYWDWSRKLDLGYYSKPPMIAWVNAASTALLGISAQAVRMPAVVFGAIGLIGLYLCGRRMFNGEVAFWAVAAWLATPATAALGLIMATDVLLVCCWCLALYSLWRAIDSRGSGAFWWLATMLLIGLGSLSKQMMMVFPLLMLIYLLFSEDRKLLKTKWPWLTWLGSLLFLIPPLWWNFQHDWITFRHTAHHVEPIGTSLLDHFKTFGEFIGGQLGLLTPITWLLLFLLSFALLLKLLRWSRQTKYLFIFGALGLLGFTGLSFKQSINPNWPATFYPAMLLLLAAWGKEQLSAGFYDRLRRWFVPGVKLGIALTFIAYLLPFVMQLSFLPLGKKDPTYRIKGWQELGAQVGEILEQQPRPEQTFIISPLRKYPAEVAFYTPGNPTTYKWPGNPPRVSSQYELWPGPVDKLGWDALILHNADSELPKDLAAAFQGVVEIGERSIPIGAAGERKYKLWRGENLTSWPERN